MAEHEQKRSRAQETLEQIACDGERRLIVKDLRLSVLNGLAWRSPVRLFAFLIDHDRQFGLAMVPLV